MASLKMLFAALNIYIEELEKIKSDTSKRNRAYWKRQIILARKAKQLLLK